MSVTVTTSLTAAQVPVPIALAPPSYGTPSPFVAGSTLYAATLNALNAQTIASATTGSGIGAIITGLQISASGTDLNLSITPGQIQTSSGPQGTTSSTTLAIAPSSTVYVFATFNASFAVGTSTTTTPPAHAFAYLGRVITSATVITALDNSGTLTFQGPIPTRYTADTLQPADTPTPGTAFITITPGNTYLFNGTTYTALQTTSAQRTPSFNSQTLSADITLTPTSPSNQFLIANSANRNVNLPAPATITQAHAYQIVNSGNASTPSQDFNLIVKSDTGTTLATLTPGQAVSAFLIPPTAALTSPAWPASLTPGAPQAPL